MHSYLRKSAGTDLVIFFRHAGNYVIAAFLIQGLSLFTLPLFTRLLTPADFGMLAILASMVAILNIIYRMGIQEAVMRYYYEEKDDFSSFYGSSFLLTLAWALVFTTLLIAFSDQLGQFFRAPAAIVYIGIGVSFFYVFFGLYEGYLIASKNSRKAALLSLAASLTIVVIAVLLIIQMTGNRYMGKAYAILAANAFLGVFSMVIILKKSNLTIDKNYISYALLFGLPLIFHSFSNFLLKSFDIIIINQLAGSAPTGLYSVAYKVGLVQSMVVLAMLKAWNPLFFEKLNHHQYDDLNRILSKFASIVYLGAFGLVLFARELMIVLADSSFHEALGIIPIIVIAHVFLFMCSIYLNFALYKKKTRLVAIITLIAAGLNIGLNYWLIPIFGYQVAAWTTLAAYLFLFVVHYLNARYLLNTEWISPLRVLIPNLLILLVFVSLFLLAGKIENIYVFFIVKICLLFFLAALYFNAKIRDYFVRPENE